MKLFFNDPKYRKRGGHYCTIVSTLNKESLLALNTNIKTKEGFGQLKQLARKDRKIWQNDVVEKIINIYKNHLAERKILKLAKEITRRQQKDEAKNQHLETDNDPDKDNNDDDDNDKKSNNQKEQLSGKNNKGRRNDGKEELSSVKRRSRSES